MNRQSTAEPLQDIVCPFCGLCCDDLSVTRAGQELVIDTPCPRARAGFAAPGADAANGTDALPQIAGTPCTLDDAVAYAAQLLGAAHQPLFAGLGTDVAGVRALLRLADRCGASFDHMNSTAMLRNLLVLQDSGWMTTTLGEARNRADVLLLFGGGVERSAPRFYERLFGAGETLFGRPRRARELIIVGEGEARPPVEESVRTTRLHCDTRRLGEVAMALRALQRGAHLHPSGVAGIALEPLRAVLDRLRSADYGVIAWTAAELDFPHAELAVQAFCELATALNETTRCAALMPGGDNAEHTLAQVATWQTGYPTRASLAAARPDFDPIRHDSARLLREAEADVLLWVSAFDRHRTPPPCQVPAIVLGRHGMRPASPPAVFIPVGTPGIDHPGHVFRCDGVTALPLRALRHSVLPPVSDTLQAVLAAL